MTERFIDDDSLIEIRGTLDANLPHRCDIQTDVGTSTAGAHRAQWQSAPALVACALSPYGAGSEALRNDQTQSIAQWVVRFALGTIVGVRNRLVVTGTEFGSGAPFCRTLVVVSIPGPKSIETARRVIARDATAAEQ